MLKRNHEGDKFMESHELQAVHSDDLIPLLDSLGVYNGICDGKYRCIFCQNLITLDNLDAIIPNNGEIAFSCNDEACHLRLITMGGDLNDP